MSSSRRAPGLLLAAAALLAVPVSLAAQAYDPELLVLVDFSDGDGELQQIEAGGTGAATYSIVGDEYRIQTTAAAQPGVAPASAAAVAPDFDFGRPLSVGATLAEFPVGVQQHVGLLACAEFQGGRPHSGYLLGLERNATEVLIGTWRFDDGELVEVFANPVQIEPDRPLRLELSVDDLTTGVLFLDLDYADDGSGLAGLGVSDDTYTIGTSGLYVEGSADGGAADVTFRDLRLGLDVRARDDFELGEVSGFHWTLNGDAQAQGSNPALTYTTPNQEGSIISSVLTEELTNELEGSFRFTISGDEGTVVGAIMDADVHGPESHFGTQGPGAGSIAFRITKNAAAGVQSLEVLVNDLIAGFFVIPNELQGFDLVEFTLRDGLLTVSMPEDGVDTLGFDVGALGWQPAPLRFGMAGISSATATIIRPRGFEVRMRDVAPKLAGLNRGEGVKSNFGDIALELLGGGVAGEPFSLRTRKGPSGKQAALFLGLDRADVPFKSGVLVPMPDWILSAVTGNGGRLAFTADWPAGVPAGFSLFAHAWVADANSGHPSGLAASNAVEMRMY